jgi:hypothetical protein
LVESEPTANVGSSLANTEHKYALEPALYIDNQPVEEAWPDFGNECCFEVIPRYV